MTHRKRTTCRACAGRLETIHAFGDLALTSAFPAQGEPDAPLIPMTLCSCETCGLAQLAETTDPSLMYRDGYGYLSGTNEAMRAHLAGLVDSLRPYVNIGDTVLDIACNDGTLLKAWGDQYRRVGIDPIAHGIENAEIVQAYFDRASYGDRPRAKAITACSMFYDLDEPQGFCRDLAACLDPAGVAVIELGYVGALLDGAFDVLCHEHLAYYGVSQIRDLFRNAGLRVFDVKFNFVNGGSAQIWLCHDGAAFKETEDAETVRAREAVADGIDWRGWAKRLRDWRYNINETLEGLGPASIMGLGASTKGNFTLQVGGIGDMVRAVADRSPHKLGRRTPGTNIPIISEAQMREMRPDYLIALPWHFRDGLLEREKVIRAQGTRFIFPLPEIEIV